MRVARVIVDVRSRSLDRAFDYAVPEALAERTVVGAPVVVPFGARTALGYVTGFPARAGVVELKSVSAVVGEPVFGPHAPALAEWIASEYVCGLADAIRPFLPPGGTPSVRNVPGGGHELVPPETRAVEDRWVEATERADPDAIRGSAVRQRAVLESLRGGPLRLAELRAELGDIGSAVTRLAERGMVRVESARKYRRPVTEPVGTRPGALTADQSAALSAVRALEPGGALLLDGVTGSGKTEVYMRAIEDLLEDGRSAIVLVPEISLTPQTVGRFRARFGDRVAVLHSRLSKGERFDQWELARHGDVAVVVGPRSALFAPVRDLGLVVIDEEHEPSYKQGGSPRYHAREVARELCRQVGSVLMLGSATPSMESLASVESGETARVSLTTRATGASLPDVTVVDMTREFAEGHRSMFSRPLRDALAGLERTRGKGILFLNRRGFASFLLCRDCGHVPECGSCSVSMTYHETGERLTCHHCAATRPVPGACPECGSPYLRRFGAGTQRVEAELRAVFPGLAVVRMDADTTSAKGGHEARLAEFRASGSGLLLGTQMIAKGLDFPDVTLVGVLDADTALCLPDFRAGERTYQLLEQVSGRAGRDMLPGEVYVQTYWPDHHAVRAVAQHRPELFYGPETESRRRLGYPPYGRLANVRVHGRVRSDVHAAAAGVADALRQQDAEGVEVLGPSPSPIERVRGAHRWHVLVKAPSGAPLPALVRAATSALRVPQGVTVAPDVDPMDLM